MAPDIEGLTGLGPKAGRGKLETTHAQYDPKSVTCRLTEGLAKVMKSNDGQYHIVSQLSEAIAEPLGTLEIQSLLCGQCFEFRDHIVHIHAIPKIPCYIRLQTLFARRTQVSVGLIQAIIVKASIALL